MTYRRRFGVFRATATAVCFGVFRATATAVCFIAPLFGSNIATPGGVFPPNGADPWAVRCPFFFSCLHLSGLSFFCLQLGGFDAQLRLFHSRVT